MLFQAQRINFNLFFDHSQQTIFKNLIYTGLILHMGFQSQKSLYFQKMIKIYAKALPMQRNFLLGTFDYLIDTNVNNDDEYIFFCFQVSVWTFPGSIEKKNDDGAFFSKGQFDFEKLTQMNIIQFL